MGTADNPEDFNEGKYEYNECFGFKDTLVGPGWWKVQAKSQSFDCDGPEAPQHHSEQSLFRWQSTCFVICLVLVLGRASMARNSALNSSHILQHVATDGSTNDKAGSGSCTLRPQT